MCKEDNDNIMLKLTLDIGVINYKNNIYEKVEDYGWFILQEISLNKITDSYSDIVETGYNVSLSLVNDYEYKLYLIFYLNCADKDKMSIKDSLTEYVNSIFLDFKFNKIINSNQNYLIKDHFVETILL